MIVLVRQNYGYTEFTNIHSLGEIELDNMRKQDKVCNKCKQSFKWGYDIEDYNLVSTYGVCKACYGTPYKEEEDLLDYVLESPIKGEN